MSPAQNSHPQLKTGQNRPNILTRSILRWYLPDVSYVFKRRSEKYESPQTKTILEAIRHIEKNPNSRN